MTASTEQLGTPNNPPVRRVGVLGAGWIGRQIAARCALFGLQVTLFDANTEALTAARQWIDTVSENEWAKLGIEVPQQFYDAWKERIAFSSTSESEADDLRDKVAQELDLVIECVPEQIAIKRRVLRQWSRRLPPRCILTSNSSYFTPSVLERFVEHPQRFAHLHFHAPVLRDSACDIVRGNHTLPEIVAHLVQFCREIRQEPIVLHREHPGYLFNWMLQAMLKAALELHLRGVADIAQIDAAWRAVSGMPVGPFQIMDQIGLDVVEHSLANARWSDLEPISTESLRRLLESYTNHGRLGVKAGSGFYEYHSGETQAQRDPPASPPSTT
ncbi:MAG: 3-hydroxybutyryl-CoA dehydrogenase [Pirellulaceae bacterium]|nr:MAG: 3-hydroxybutyryl-CoA dehydrogenase [Pirellulaceae bacterium]